MKASESSVPKTAAVFVDVKALTPWAKNPRKNDPAVKAVADSIKRFGFGAPLLARQANGEIIAGHTRLKAAIKLGLTEVPVRYLDLTESEAHALALADNKVGELAEWDDAVLAEVLKGMAEAGDNIEGLGWSSNDIQKMITEPGTEDGEVMEPPAEPITKPGNLWLLGNHRLLCGDSTKAEDVERLMAGAKAELMVTDPPYGVKLDQSWRDKALGDKAMGPGNRNVVANDDKADWTETWSLFGGDVAYVWHAGKFSDVVMASLRNAGFEICQQLIWNKSVMVMGRSDYHFKHEPCWYAVRKGRSHGWIGDRKQTTVIDAKSPNHIMSGSDEEKTNHPTQKPVECMAYLMRNHDGSVYDPFLGSGTTLIAAEQLGRKCYGMELSPAYCDVIINRWETLTGKKATLDV